MSKFGLVSALCCLTFAGTAPAQTLYGFNYHATNTTPWAGPYVGVHGGYAIGEDSTARFRPGVLPGNATAIAAGNRPAALVGDKDGYVAGGQVGWNVQAGRVVAGVEADASFTDFSVRQRLVGLNGDQSSLASRNTYLATVRGRAGYVAPGGVLLYGTGGFATTEVKDQALFRGPAGAPLFAGSHESHPPGWVAGAGAEVAIPVSTVSRYAGFLGHSAVTTRVEWLHYDFRDKSLNIAALPGGAGGYVSRVGNTADVIRAGFNFKF